MPVAKRKSKKNARSVLPYFLGVITLCVGVGVALSHLSLKTRYSKKAVAAISAKSEKPTKPILPPLSSLKKPVQPSAHGKPKSSRATVAPRPLAKTVPAPSAITPPLSGQSLQRMTSGLSLQVLESPLAYAVPQTLAPVVRTTASARPKPPEPHKLPTAVRPKTLTAKPSVLQKPVEHRKVAPPTNAAPDKKPSGDQAIPKIPPVEASQQWTTPAPLTSKPPSSSQSWESSHYPRLVAVSPSEAWVQVSPARTVVVPKGAPFGTWGVYQGSSSKGALFNGKIIQLN